MSRGEACRKYPRGVAEQPDLDPDATVRTVLDGIPGMVGYWDRELRNRVANRAYVELFGHDPQKVPGMHMREMLGADLFTQNLPLVEAVLAGEPQQFDRVVVDGSGRARHLQTSYTPDRRDGEVLGFYVQLTDVSDRVRAERRADDSVAQYRALARSLPSGFVLLFDQDLRIQIADGSDLAAFGFSAQTMEGRTLHEALPDLAEFLEPRWRAALAGETVTWDREHDPKVFRLTAAPVRADDGTITSGMVLTTDITEERRNERSWDALHEIATAVGRNEPPHVVARRMAASLHQVFRVDSAAVIRFTGPGTGHLMAAEPPGALSLPEVIEFHPSDASSLARVAFTGQPALVHYRRDGGSVAASMTSDGMAMGCAAPIRADNTLWGAVALTSTREDRLDDEVLARLDGFAELLGLAVGNTAAWTALEREAATDALSGLPNRRTFSDHLRREIERARRYGHPLSVALLDLDGLKWVNDTRGHVVGDRVIAELAARLRTEARDGELLARLGGDEFGWILPETDGDGAAAAAERLRLVVRSAPFSGVGNLSVSVGVCALDDVSGPEDLVAAADEALYVAKRAGRDRVARYGVTRDTADRPA